MEPDLASTERTETQGMLRTEEDPPATIHPVPTDPKVPLLEEVLEELNNATKLYLSCPDPVKAAARRQRVMITDAAGKTEERAASLIVAEAQRKVLLSGSRSNDSNPNTPPPPAKPGFPATGPHYLQLTNDEFSTRERSGRGWEGASSKRRRTNPCAKPKGTYEDQINNYQSPHRD